MSRRGTGTRAETAAVIYLFLKGYRILDRNYFTSQGELDIVAKKRGVLVFVEVRSKTKASAQYFGRPAETVTPAKQRSIIRSARRYLGENIVSNAGCRFDVIEATKGRFIYRLNHIKDAFICDFTNRY